MEVVYRRCCGLDVHKDSITACVLVLDNGQRQVRIKEFKTYWKELAEIETMAIFEQSGIATFHSF